MTLAWLYERDAHRRFDEKLDRDLEAITRAAAGEVGEAGEAMGTTNASGGASDCPALRFPVC